MTDGLLTDDGALLAAVDASLAAGLPAVQLRAKGLPAGALLSLASHLRASSRRHGGALLVNDRVDVALAVDADGVHLPASSLPPDVARRLLGPFRSVGVSTHSAAEVEAAGQGGADYVVFGPVFDTPSKRSFGPPLGLDALAEVCRRSSVPVIAIGGVTLERLAAIRGRGARGVAMIRGLLQAADPGDATRRALAAWAAAAG